MTDLLTLEAVSAGYGEAIAINSVSFSLPTGGALALLGRNGAGKTTLINTIVGLTRLRGGRLTFAGADITRLPPERRAAAGIGWVPQERNIFRSLSVEENLTAVANRGAWDVERVYRLFPRLRERRRNMGNQLSGGEQQMLAIARALVLNPKIILLDEPLEGLAPVIVDELLAVLRQVVVEEGLTAIIVEQKARKVLPFTDHSIVLDRGSIVYRASSAELLADPAELDRRLGVQQAA